MQKLEATIPTIISVLREAIKKKYIVLGLIIVVSISAYITTHTELNDGLSCITLGDNNAHDPSYNDYSCFSIKNSLQCWL